MQQPEEGEEGHLEESRHAREEQLRACDEQMRQEQDDRGRQLEQAKRSRGEECNLSEEGLQRIQEIERRLRAAVKIQCLFRSTKARADVNGKRAANDCMWGGAMNKVFGQSDINTAGSSSQHQGPHDLPNGFSPGSGPTMGVALMRDRYLNNLLKHGNPNKTAGRLPTGTGGMQGANPARSKLTPLDGIAGMPDKGVRILDAQSLDGVTSSDGRQQALGTAGTTPMAMQPQPHAKLRCSDLAAIRARLSELSEQLQRGAGPRLGPGPQGSALATAGEHNGLSRGGL